MGISEFFSAIFRRGRQADHEAAQAIDVPGIEMGRQIIEDAERQIAGFERKVAELIASRKDKEAKVPNLEAQIKKYDAIAAKAGAAGNADDVREAVTDKKNFENQLAIIRSEIAKDAELEKKFRAQIVDARTKINRASDKKEEVAAREESVKVRQGLSNINSGGGALGKIDDWEKKVDHAEHLADAQDELAGTSDPAKVLEQKYSSSNADIEDEVAKYMKPSQPSTATVQKGASGQL